MYEEIGKNKRNSFLLIAAFVVFIVFLGWIFGEIIYPGFGIAGLFIAFVIAILFAFFGYYFSDKIVLSISHAREVKKEEYPYLFNLIDGISMAAGLPKPKAYVIDDTALNAFATGRDPEHSVIVATTGLLHKLNREELEGVIAHEMSHIKNYDIRMMTLAVVFVGVVALLSDMMIRSMLWGRHDNRGRGGIGIILLVVGIILAILAPLIATLLKLAVSREREYLADASGAMLTRNPNGLASALEKISGDKEPLEAANKATAHLYISNPLKGSNKGWFDGMFSTHPPVEKRIARLREM
ncbi:MAG: zinc metalloprotease HtpX [Candidatus Diapherotrites archaeon]|nr:zinc metalloprotease HtpX [Candidatus Diapherotrites archaeon]